MERIIAASARCLPGKTGRGEFKGFKHSGRTTAKVFAKGPAH